MYSNGSKAVDLVSYTSLLIFGYETPRRITKRWVICTFSEIKIYSTVAAAKRIFCVLYWIKEYRKYISIPWKPWIKMACKYLSHVCEIFSLRLDLLHFLVKGYKCIFPATHLFKNIFCNNSCLKSTKIQSRRKVINR